MSAFVLATKHRDDLETTVFSSEAGDAVAIFTDSGVAQQYIDDAGWQDDMTVAELTSIDLIEWLVKCYRNGVRLMATDPVRSEQQSGLRIDALDIESQLEHAGSHIVTVANPDF